MSVWQRGDACLVHGEWPAHVTAVDPRGRATVVFCGGDAPEGMQPTATIATSALARPPGARHLRRNFDRWWITKPLWSGADLRELRRRVASQTFAQIAPRLGRSPAACHCAYTRWWGRLTPQRQTVALTQRQVADVLGVDQHRVERLQRAGLIEAARSSVACGPNVKWAYTIDALDAFLRRHPEHYDVARVTGEPWARIAHAVNAADPVLTVAEAAARVYTDPSTITRHIRRGWLRATWTGLGKRGRGVRGWRIRASQLDRFTFWPARSTARYHAWCRRSGYMTTAEAARHFGIAQSTVTRRIRAGTIDAVRYPLGGRVLYGVRRPDALAAWRAA